MLYPVLPLFLTGVLGAPVAAVGLIEGVAEATASAMKIVSGRLADLRRRRPMIAAGYGLSSLAKPMIGLAQAWPFVLVARFVDRTGKGIRTSPRDALIADETPSHLRGRAFGFHRAADTAGAVVGPLIGLAMYEMLDHNIRPLFFIVFIPAAISVFLIAFVHEAHINPSRIRRVEDHGRPVADALLESHRISRVLRPRELLRRSPDFAREGSGFGLRRGDPRVCALQRDLRRSFVSRRSLSDRVPRRLVFATGLAIFAVAYLGLGIITTSAWVWPLFAIYGGYTALTDGVGKAWVADLVPADREGSGLGFYQGIVGAGSLVAGIWAGLAWNGTGRLPLIVSGTVVAFLSITLFAIGRRLERA